MIPILKHVNAIGLTIHIENIVRVKCPEGTGFPVTTTVGSDYEREESRESGVDGRELHS
jgi:hypothetical protein